MISALTGQAKVSLTVFVYFVIAVLLLSYVSAQFYGGMLRQEISSLKQNRSDLKEDLNKLTSAYVALSSRSKVSEYCENKLGMVKASGDNFELLAVEGGELGFAVPVEITKKQSAIQSAYRYPLRRCDEKPGQ